MLVRGRKYANTEKGERNIMRILNTIFAVFVVNLALLIIGSII